MQYGSISRCPDGTACFARTTYDGISRLTPAATAASTMRAARLSFAAGAVFRATTTASWPLKASVSSSTAYASETSFTGIPEGNLVEEVARVRMVTLKDGSARRAERIGAPIEPLAPATMMFLRGVDIVVGSSLGHVFGQYSIGGRISRR
jgi:hypothetical protein